MRKPFKRDSRKEVFKSTYNQLDSMNTITIYYNSMAVIIFQEVADMLNLFNGQEICTQDEMMDIITENAKFGPHYIEVKRLTLGL